MINTFWTERLVLIKIAFIHVFTEIVNYSRSRGDLFAIFTKINRNAFPEEAANRQLFLWKWYFGRKWPAKLDSFYFLNNSEIQRTDSPMFRLKDKSRNLCFCSRFHDYISGACVKWRFVFIWLKPASSDWLCLVFDTHTHCIRILLNDCRPSTCIDNVWVNINNGLSSCHGIYIQTNIHTHITRTFDLATFFWCGSIIPTKMCFLSLSFSLKHMTFTFTLLIWIKISSALETTYH